MDGIPTAQTKKSSNWISVDDELLKFRSLCTTMKPWFGEGSSLQIWWQKYESEFPRISKIKIRVDSLSATTIDCEQAFSLSAFAMPDYSNRMSFDKIKLRMADKCNLAPSIKQEIEMYKLNLNK